MQKLQAEFETITPEIAKKYLEKNVDNRPITDKNLEGLAYDMKRDNFALTGDPIIFSKNGKLIDGQHRLLALIKTGITAKMLVVRGLDDEAFKYIDTGRNRKASDVLAIEGVKNATTIAAITKFIINFKRGKYSDASTQHVGYKDRITNSDISEFANKNLKSIIESQAFGFNKDNKLVSGTYLAGLHYIFKAINEEEANDFCHKLADGSNLNKTSPIFLLRQVFLNDIRSTMSKMKVLTKLALICKAWNLYRKDSVVQRLSWNSVKDPFPKPI